MLWLRSACGGSGGEPAGLESNELMGEERDTTQPSLALGSASAVLGPDRGKFTGVSTTGVSTSGQGSETSGDRSAVASMTPRFENLT